MSKKTEPIRSRRKLREQSVRPANAGASPADPDESAQAAPAQRPRGERESEIRARDRAALRAHQEPIDAPALNPLPSRRALRQAQLDADRAPITAVNPVVSAAATALSKTAPAAPASKPEPAAKPAAAAPAAPKPNAAGAGAESLNQAGQTPLRPRSGRRAAMAAAPTVHSKPQAPTSLEQIAAAAQSVGASPSLVSPDGAAERMYEGGPLAGDVDANYPPMPGLVPGGSYYPVSAGPPQVLAPSGEELRALGGQKADAERAAILGQRTQARERLAQENDKSKRPAPDPTATNNLAMVTPLQFIDVPGATRPVMLPPATTHVPIVSRATPRQTPPRQHPAPTRPAAQGRPPAATQPAPSPSVPSVSAERFDAGKPAAAKPSAVMPADAAGAVQRSKMPPMPADYAHGLEPLDAVTAGLGRTQRNKLIQWGAVLIVGIALIIGVIMFLSS